MERKTVSYRPVVMGVVCFLVGFVFYMVGSYQLESRRQLRQIDSTLETEAASLPMVLGPDAVSRLLALDVTEEEYARYVRLLSDYADLHGMDYLYILKQTPEGVVNIVTSATPEEWETTDYQASGEKYGDDLPNMTKAFATGTIQSDDTADQFGHTRSVFIPYRDPADGNPYILGADLSMDDVRRMQFLNLMRSVITGVCFPLFVTPLLVLTSRDLKAQRNRLAMEVREQTAHINTLNDTLQQRLAEVERQAEVSKRALQEAEAARQESITARQEGTMAAARRLEQVLLGLDSSLQVLTERVNDSRSGAGEQARKVTETVGVVNAINDSFLDVARNAGSASDLTASVRKDAHECADIARRAVRGMQQVNQETTALKTTMEALEEYTRSITRIMSMISDIADQTNLLALNAAIEAARAGDAGRGFAVVADEVRKLAEKTMASTTEVADVVDRIGQSTRQSMRQMDVAAGVIQEAMDLVEESGTALDRIQSVIDNAADEVGHIATVVQHQSESSSEITGIIQTVHDIANLTADHMQEAEAALQQLAGQTRSLGDMVEDMKNG